MLTVCHGCKQIREQPETWRQSPGRGEGEKWGSPIPWEEGPAAAGAHELSQRGGNAAPAARLTALGTLWVWGPSPQHQRGRLREQRGAGTPGRSQAERSCSRPQPPPAHGDAVSHRGAGADGNAPLPALLPASLQQLPQPPGSPSAGRAPLQPCLAAPESRGPDSDPPKAARLLCPQSQHQPTPGELFSWVFVAGSLAIWGRRSKGRY